MLVRTAHVPCFGLIAAVVLAGDALAQDKPDRPPWAQPSPPAATASKPPAPAPVNPGDYSPDPVPDPIQDPGKIRVNVNLVNVLASVLDEHNRPAPDLPIEAFQLFEEGVQQKIEVFESETQQPLDLALMIDASLSAHKEISFEQEAAAHFIRQVLRPDDRLAVYAFDENVTQVAAFSDKVAPLQEAVRRIPPGARTSIYDAVLLASHALEKRGEDRRPVVLKGTYQLRLRKPYLAGPQDAPPPVSGSLPDLRVYTGKRLLDIFPPWVSNARIGDRTPEQNFLKSQQIRRCL